MRELRGKWTQVQLQPVAEEDRAHLGVGDFEPSRNPTGRSASYDERLTARPPRTARSVRASPEADPLRTEAAMKPRSPRLGELSAQRSSCGHLRPLKDSSVPTPSCKGSLRIAAISRYANRTAPGVVARCLGWHCGHTVRSEHSGWTSGGTRSHWSTRNPADDRDQPPGYPLRRQPALLMITFRAFCSAASANVSYASRNWSKVKR